MNLLSGKVAVVTGVNRGIGLAILNKFASYGSDIYGVVRSLDSNLIETGQKLEEKYQVSIKFFEADFADESQVNLVAKKILAEKRNIDVIVNNIGMAHNLSMFNLIKSSEIKYLFQINFFSAITFSQILVRSMMKSKRGSIVFISSSAAFDGGANIDYSASKAAIIGASRRMAVELGKFGIRVNVIAPGLTSTDMGNSMSEKDEKIALSRNVFKRKAEPDEIADVVSFFASDMSRFVTGQVLRVDGGLL